MSKGGKYLKTGILLKGRNLSKIAQDRCHLNDPLGQPHNTFASTESYFLLEISVILLEVQTYGLQTKRSLTPVTLVRPNGSKVVLLRQTLKNIVPKRS